MSDGFLHCILARIFLRTTDRQPIARPMADEPSPPPPRRLRLILLATALLYGLFLAAASAGFWVNRNGRLYEGDVDLAKTREALASEDRGTQFLRILGNNFLYTAALLALGAITLGLYTPFATATFGFLMGAQAGELHVARVSNSFLAAYFLPHGVLEILGFSLAGATSLVAGRAFVRYLRGGPLYVPDETRFAAWAIGVAFGILAVAAVLEVQATPRLCLPLLDPH